ncbi:hypothetical protein HpBT123_05830 [Helicobacter pylori]
MSVKYAQVDPNDPKKEIFITDEEQSNLARQKAEELKEAFKDWIYKDYARRTHLEQIYNDTFNNSVLKTYDGSQLELEGFNHHISLRPHQKNAIFRTIQDRAVCLDHQVGAGKTLCAIASCMEQKRMGLVNKTLIAVPNHLTKQWGDEFYRAYPNANVLVVDSKDITEKERELLFNQIANNNYDAVIIAHTHLELLSNPRGIIEELKEEELVNAEKNFIRSETSLPNFTLFNRTGNITDTLKQMMDKYEYILIDTKGEHSKESQRAMLLSDWVLIPTTPSQLDTAVLLEMLERIRDIQALNENLKACIVMNRIPTIPTLKEKKALIDFINQNNANESVFLMDNILSERMAYRVKVWA